MFKRAALLIFLLGLFLRLFLMPWALQADLISMSYRAHLMSEYGLWGMNSSQPLGHYLYALNLKVFAAFLPNIKTFFPNEFGTTLANATSSVGDWLNFVSNPQVNAFIFTLKIPHLLVDIAIFWILAKFFAKDKKRNLILSLWWFNPVNIYAFYVFARHDSLTSLALLLGVLFLAKEKILTALLSLFAAVQIRFQPLLYLPLFLIHLWRNFSIKKLGLNIFFAMLSVVIILVTEKNLPFDRNLYEQISGSSSQIAITKTALPNSIEAIQKAFVKPFELATSVGGRSSLNKLLVFSGSYVFLNLFYLFVKKAQNQKESFLQINLVLYLSLALYFLVNDFSPHYFVWLSLFASVGVLIGQKFLYAYLLTILGWGIMGLVDPGNFAINQNLFLPVSPVIFNTPQIAYLLNNQKLWFDLGRLILDFGLLWSGFLAIKYLFGRTERLNNWKKILKIGPVILCLFFFCTGAKVEAAKVPVLEKENNAKILLRPGLTYSNYFISPVTNFGALDLKFDTSRSLENKNLVFRLKAEGASTWYYEHTYNASDFYNNAFYPFGFPPISDALGRKFIYEVELLDQADLPFSVYEDTYVLSKEGSMGEILTIIKSDLLIKWQNQKAFFTFWLALLGLNSVALLIIIFSPQKKDSLL